MTTEQKTKGIFVNYRRSDSGPFAGRIFDRLNSAFPGLVFYDIEQIQPGEDFVKKIEEKIRACSVVVMIIGKNWTPMLHEGSDFTKDFVVMELRIALEQGKPIMPVLLEGVTMPKEDALPVDLQPLARRNAVEVGHARFERDARALAQALSFFVGQKPLFASLRWPPGARLVWFTAIIAAFIQVRLTADDPIIWVNFWAHINPLFVIPLLTSGIALRWPIPKEWAAAFVIVIQSIVILVPIPYMVSVATIQLRPISISVGWGGIAASIFAILLNVSLVMFICARAHRS